MLREREKEITDRDTKLNNYTETMHSMQVTFDRQFNDLNDEKDNIKD